MFCIRCGGWISYRADYCKHHQLKPYKDKVSEEESNNIFPEVKASMRQAGKKSYITRKKQQKALYNELKNTHYIVEEIAELTGTGKSKICKIIFKKLASKCIKKYSRYYIPKELLTHFQKAK